MTSASDWFLTFVPRPRARLRLYCLAHAGGSAASTRSWCRALPDDIEVCSVQLPGRGARLREEPLRRVDELVGGLADALARDADRPFALHGHSFGGLLAFELSRELRRRERPGPTHLLATASPAPRHSRLQRRVHDLPDDRFLEELERLGGTPKEILASDELMQLVLPPLRADFEAIAHYEYSAAPPLDCPISVFGGSRDTLVPPHVLMEWSSETRVDCFLKMVAGDHFFPLRAPAVFFDALAERLRRRASEPGEEEEGDEPLRAAA